MQQTQQAMRMLMITLAAASASLFTRHGSLLPIAKFSFAHHVLLSSSTMNPIFYLQHVVLGILTGLIATLFNAIFYSQNIKRMFNHLPKISQMMIGSVSSSISLLAIGESQALPDGFSYINRMLTLKSSSFLPSASYFLLKFMSMGLCISSGMLGGLVGPSLFLGSSLGQSVAAISVLRVQDHAIYYASGAAAMLASIFKSPMTAILVMIEMSARLEVFPPITITTITAIVTMNILSMLMTTQKKDVK
jgi:chloride channel protein, CIC family